MKKSNRLIVGTAFSLAALAVAIDHTQHRLPEPVSAEQEQGKMSEDESPCGMGADESPCGMGADESPCGMGEEESSPCSMDSDDADSSPCGLGG